MKNRYSWVAPQGAQGSLGNGHIKSCPQAACTTLVVAACFVQRQAGHHLSLPAVKPNPCPPELGHPQSISQSHPASKQVCKLPPSQSLESGADLSSSLNQISGYLSSYIAERGWKGPSIFSLQPDASICFGGFGGNQSLVLQLIYVLGHLGGCSSLLTTEPTWTPSILLHWPDENIVCDWFCASWLKAAPPTWLFFPAPTPSIMVLTDDIHHDNSIDQFPDLDNKLSMRRVIHVCRGLQSIL